MSVVGFVISTQFADHSTPRHLGTFWAARLVECLAGRVALDKVGKPLIRYCHAYSVLQLVPEDRTSGWPCFNVADLGTHPEYLLAWVARSRREHLFGRRVESSLGAASPHET